jgi:hypothetical protein
VTAAAADPAAVILDHVWVGAGIHIHTGGPEAAREPFLPWRDLPDDPDQVFALLSWRVRLAPLFGRDRNREALLDWARRGRNARIRLLTGPSGVGKSRLAAEVAEALRAEGWTAGFVRPNDSAVVPLRRAGLFLIVDYPEEHPEAVQTLLSEAASGELRDAPLRLLILSRRGGERWLDLVESAHAGELMDAQGIGLGGLAAADPERVFFGSLQRLTEHFRRSTKAIPARAVRDWVAQNPVLHGLPLLLTAASIHAFLHPDATLGFGGASIIEALTERERARLGNAGRAAGLGERSAGRVVALAAVPGLLDAGALRRLAEPGLEIGLPPPERVIDAVQSLPWWRDDHVAAPDPDLMAAALLVKILAERSDKAASWLWAVIEDAVGPRLVDRLGRLAFDAMTATGSTEGIVGHLRQIIRDDPSRAEKLQILVYLDLPFGLARFASDVTRALLATSRDEADTATYLNNLSSRLHEAGDGVGALEAIREAVEIRRRLAEDDPARFAADLALSLNNLSNRLSDAGDGANALTAICEAVNIQRPLAQDTAARFAADLARSLNNLSLRLSDAGDGAGALAAIGEAAHIYRRLARENPARFASALARSLNNLSNCLGDAGDGAGALTAIREAVEIRRQLAEENPARFTPDLASSLNNLSNRLGNTGDAAGALPAIREAADIYRRLAQENPARFAPDLATSLNNLSSSLTAAGSGDDGLTAIREAVVIRRRLAQENPGRFTPDLASSLNNLSASLRNAGDAHSALIAIREATDNYRRLAQENPARFAPDLATSLGNLSTNLRGVGDDGGALMAIREAVEIRRRLVAKNPARFADELASSLHNLSICLNAAGEASNALTAIREAVEIRRRLAQEDPARFAPALERSLRRLESLEKA